MILVDGEPAVAVPALDRALHYGDGVFETMACRGGRVRWLDEHLARLARGCRRLGFEPPAGDLLRTEIDRLAGQQAQAVVKLIVSRGRGGRGYAPPPRPVATRILLRYPMPPPPPHDGRGGVRLRLARTRLAVNPVLAGIKHLNRLEQVLARAEWDPAGEGIAESLMLDTGGRLIEGTATNVFLVRARRLVTPDLSGCGIEGVLRGRIIAEARRRGIEVEVREVRPEELGEADELFVGNSVIGIWPAIACGPHRYPLGDIAAGLQAALGPSG